MSSARFSRRRSRLFLVPVLLAVLAACEDERPPVSGSNASASSGSATASSPSSGSGASAGQTTSYGPIESFQSASPGYNTTGGQRNGLTASSGNPGAAEPQAAAAPGNMNALVNDVRNAVDSGGSVVVVITGHTDGQHQNSNNATLAEHRAFVAAWALVDDLGRPASVVADRSMCGAGACIVYEAHLGARANEDLGRFASATATFTAPARPSAEGFRGIDDPRGGGSGGGGGGGRDVVVNPPACLLLCSRPPAPPSGGGGDGEFSRPPVWSPVPPVSSPAIPDPFDVSDAEVRIVVDVPATFRAGGALRPHELRVVSVEVLCGSEVCVSIDTPRVGALEALLRVRSLAAGYEQCPSRLTSGCEFFLEPDPLRVEVRDGRLVSGSLVAGFFSPTPSRVVVYPELLVDELSVREAVPVWVGGADCDPADVDCWEFLDGADLDLDLSVVTTSGEVFERDGDRFFLERVVVGSVGS